MLITEHAPQQATIVVAGVDTHKNTHHVAVLDLAGRVLGDREFPVSSTGYRSLLGWVSAHGVIDRIGVELTGSYGAGLTRYLTAEGVTVREVNTTDKATRARRGKNDTIDAIAAAQKVLAGMATATPKNTTSSIESIRVLTVVRDSAVKNRTQALNQLGALLVTAPAELRELLDAMNLSQVATRARSFRPDRARLADPVQAVKIALKRLGDRIQDLDLEIAAADKELKTLVTATAPTLLACYGIGTHHAARFLITASSNINRIRSEAAFARLCGAAPIPISSGKTRRMRLHRGGDRQANKALHMTIIGRFKNHPPTAAYRAKKHAEGHSKRDTIRALKRYLAREVFNALKTDLIIP